MHVRYAVAKLEFTFFIPILASIVVSEVHTAEHNASSIQFISSP